MNLTTWEELLERRPPNWERVEEIAAQMRAEVRAARLAQVRADRQMTQRELAEELQVSQNRVSQIENGQVDRAQVATLRRYVEALGGTLTIEAAFGDTRYEIV